MADKEISVALDRAVRYAVGRGDIRSPADGSFHGLSANRNRCAQLLAALGAHPPSTVITVGFKQDFDTRCSCLSVEDYHRHIASPEASQPSASNRQQPRFAVRVGCENCEHRFLLKCVAELMVFCDRTGHAFRTVTRGIGGNQQ